MNGRAAASAQRRLPVPAVCPVQNISVDALMIDRKKGLLQRKDCGHLKKYR